MNRYPAWKYTLIAFVFALGLLYALPNIYAPDPAVQITGQSSSLIIDESDLNQVRKALDAEGIEYFGEAIQNNQILVRLSDRSDQPLAKKLIQNALGIENYVIALNMADTTPDWLRSVGAKPMKLGLDLSGGVHFLLEVDTQSAIETRLASDLSRYKTELRKEKVRGRVSLEDNAMQGRFRSEELRDAAYRVAAKELPDMVRRTFDKEGDFYLSLTLGEQALKIMQDEAVGKNLVTLRNRVNELGVSEPLVQRQGRNRIVVELPGVQDTALAKKILGKTANLEFRLEAKLDAKAADKEAFAFRSSPNRKADVERDIIISGECVSDASTGFDENAMPQVNIDLSADCGKIMHRSTRNNVKRGMAVLFIERKSRKVSETIDDEGRITPVYEPFYQKEIISLATIQSPLSSSFRITGLDGAGEASELALLLRAGALAAPMDFIEERTIGPSLGAENIRLGVQSIVIGLSLVLVFMLFWYKVFGFAANIALAANMILIVAVMSILSATLTLPGIAGIVLTVGMAVDANVLIFSRIREELANGLTPQRAIDTGFDRAFVTIIDANLTTLLAAVILYAVGTGPVKGFAVTLSVGILTSMFTAIMGTRAIVNLIYGGRNIKKLLI